MRIFIISLSLVFSISSYSSNHLPKLDLLHGSAKVFTKDDKLIISTGRVERIYQLTSFGLVTTGFKNILTETEWINSNEKSLCDWAIDSDFKGKLISLNAQVSDDEKFTDMHLCVEAEFEYPQKHLMIKYIVWAYPDADGLRTQLQLKALPGFDSNKETFSSDITETLSLRKKTPNITAFGYMQGIKTNMNLNILTEKNLTLDDKVVDWANGLSISDSNEGIILIKESNKSTSLKKEGDVATGKFLLNDNKVIITGAGMYPKNLQTDQYLSCWANWVILYSGNADEANMALKKFDRKRFPVHPDRDIFMMANTWGTGDLGTESRYAAREENVLKELESVADLGIDILQIDDGWQSKVWHPAKHSSEFKFQDVIGDYDIYPSGWDKVKQRAEELKVKLGLWAASSIPLEQLKWNFDNGKFRAFKLDFANLNSIEKRDGLMEKARELIKYSDYKTCVNWDVTEILPRAGYFYGREYGNIYLENRKVTTSRAAVQYIPYKVLKDAWLLSKYVNLNKFQVSVLNIDMTKDTTITDAKIYNHPYAVGIALMSSPIFFQETQYYSQKAREQIKPILSVYKKHREAMYSGYVFPIGNEPDNKSWTGFQNYNPETNSGYLTIFRELHNNDTSKDIALKFIEDKEIKLTNLLTDEMRVIKLGGSNINFSISHPASFQFFKYEIIK